MTSDFNMFCNVVFGFLIAERELERLKQGARVSQRAAFAHGTYINLSVQ